MGDARKNVGTMSKLNQRARKILSENESVIRKRKQPGFIQPMKATLTHDHFSDKGWIYERKLDGERILIHKKSGEVTLWSRNRKKKNGVYPEITTAVEKLGPDFIADGELVTFDGNVTSFSRLQNRIHVKEPDKERIQKTPVYAYLFDILYLEGHDVRKLPQRERKQLLKAALDLSDPLRHLPHRNEKGVDYLRDACRKGWEGLIAKDAAAEYVSSRSKKWLKFKCGKQQEFVIAGYTKPKGSRVGFGALLLAYHDKEEDLVYAGRVGTGFDDDFLQWLKGKMSALKRSTCPLKDFNEETEDITWIRPKLVGEVAFTEWTQNGRLRHPRFLGLRDDKDAADVVKES